MWVWVPVVVIAITRVVIAVIDLYGRIRYERVRQEAVAAVLGAAPLGTAVWDVRADGAVLRLEIPAGPTTQEQHSGGIGA